jgi:hypothetical protein
VLRFGYLACGRPLFRTVLSAGVFSPATIFADDPFVVDEGNFG